MIESIRSFLNHFRRQPSKELIESRLQSTQNEERVKLTNKMLNSPELMTRLDLAKLLDEGWYR